MYLVVGLLSRRADPTIFCTSELEVSLTFTTEGVSKRPGPTVHTSAGGRVSTRRRSRTRRAAAYTP